MNAKVSKKPVFRAVIESEEEYFDILLGNKGIKDEHQDNVTHYEIPAAIFERLLGIDRALLKRKVKTELTTLEENDHRRKAYDTFLERFSDLE